MKFLATILIILLIVLQLKLWSGTGGRAEVALLEQSVVEQNQVNNKASERNAVLVAEIKDLKSGLTAVEERARSDLGMIKEGETFFQIIEESSATLSE